MQSTALLPLSFLGAFSIFYAVLCDHPSSDTLDDILNMNLNGHNNSSYQEKSNQSKIIHKGSPYALVKYTQGYFSERNSNFSEINNSSIISNDINFYLSSPWLTKFIPSVYTVVFIIALPLNLMAILMFVWKIKIRTPAVVYMLNLATADLLFVAVLPLNIVYRFSGNNWQIGEGMCRFVIATFYCNMYCSILLMTSMSVDKYMAVVFPIRSLSWRSKRRAWLVCGFIWLVSIAGTVPLLLKKQANNVDSLNITTCHDVLELEDQQNFYMYYFTAFSLIFFLFPLIITVFCYSDIVRTLSKSSEDIKSSSKKTRAIILTIIVLSVFIICFGPTNIILLMHYLGFLNGYSDYLYIAYLLCVCISSISNCLDPLIYYYASSRYRNYIYNLSCCKMSHKLQTQHKIQTPKQSSTESSFVK